MNADLMSYREARAGDWRGRVGCWADGGLDRLGLGRLGLGRRAGMADGQLAPDDLARGFLGEYRFQRVLRADLVVLTRS